MDTAYIAFSSSTSASRLKKLAGREGYQGISLIQAPTAISQNGCSYAIRCSMSLLPLLLQLADEYRLKHGAVYREHVDTWGRKTYHPQ